MNLRPLARPFGWYTVVAGGLTAGAVYLGTHSGLAMLLLTGVGLALLVLGGGRAGALPSANVQSATDDGLALAMEDVSLRPGSLPLRATLLFYGVGLAVWSVAVLVALQDSLH